MTETKNPTSILSVSDRLKYKLTQREEEGYIRELYHNHDKIDFCSNDYLGLANSALLKFRREQNENFHLATANGSTGSRLISGNYQATEDIEDFIACYHGAESGLIFNSGFDANLGLLSCIASENDWIFFDEYVHTSLKDGIKLSRGKSVSFAHNNLVELAAKLGDSEGRKYVVVESIYSMDGDLAPLEKLVELCKSFNAELIVDEAHAVGVFGNKGEGQVSMLGLETAVFARTVTFGKALGCHGAVVIGPNILRQYLINYAHPFIYTTALPLHSIQCVKLAYHIMSNWNHRRTKIQKLSTLFKQCLRPEIRNKIVAGTHHIISLVVSGNEQAKQLSIGLLEENIFVKAILFPTVPKGKERLRISIHSFNTEQQIRVLANTINRFTP